MLIRDEAVGVDGGARVVIVVQMDGGRCMRDGARPSWTFVVKGGLDTGKMTVIEVLICE